MDGVDFTRKFRLFDKSRKPRQDYRRKLEATSGPAGDVDVMVADPACPYAERVYELFDAASGSPTVLQAVAVTSLQTLRRVLVRQRRAALAAISLAQGDKLREMVGATETMAAALCDVLSKQGSQLLDLCVVEEPSEVDEEPSWWFALTEAMEVLDDGTERIASVVSGQPKGAPSRVLSSLVVRQLRAQRNALLVEADQWIS